MVTVHIPDLKVAWVEPGESEPVRFGEYMVPASFVTVFVLNDVKKGTEWMVHFIIEVTELGTPKLAQVVVLGNRNPNLLIQGRDGVERWQLKIVEQFRTQFFNLGLQLVIEKRKPTGEIKNSDAEDVGKWGGTPEKLDAKKLKELEKFIGTSIRRRINMELLTVVARIYTEAGTRPGGQPIQEIANHFKCSARTAQDWATKSRNAGLLPPTTPGKVTVKKSPTKTTKKGK